MKTYLHIFAVSENFYTMPFETIYKSEKGNSVDVASIIREFSKLWGVEMRNMRCFIIDKATFGKLNDYLWENKTFKVYKCAFVPKKG